MPPIDAKVMVEGHHTAVRDPLRHSHEGCIGDRHGEFSISFHQRADTDDFLGQLETHPDKAALDQLEENVGVSATPRDEEASL